MSEPPHIHRSDTAYKQKNKSFKAGKHVSKADQVNRAKGRVGDAPRASVKNIEKPNKALRKNAAKVQQQKKREDLRAKRRGVGERDGAPKIVGLIALGSKANVVQARSMLLSFAVGPEAVAGVVANPVTIAVKQHKQRFTLYASPREDVAILDCAKVADVLVFLVDAEEGIDRPSEHILSLIKAQGPPAVMEVIQGLNRVASKHRNEVKKELSRHFCSHFQGDPKILLLDDDAEAGQIFRFLATQRLNVLHWREQHSYLLAEKAEVRPTTPTHGTLLISGYLRGSSLSANQLLHIPDHGDFQILQIDGPHDPTPLSSRPPSGMVVDESNKEAVKVLDRADPSKQESLATENIPDPLANEQTWPTEEEERLDKIIRSKFRNRKVPVGTSEYQAAWIPEGEEEDEHDGGQLGGDAEEADDDDDDDDEEGGAFEDFEAQEVDDFGNIIEKMDGDDGDGKKKNRSGDERPSSMNLDENQGDEDNFDVDNFDDNQNGGAKAKQEAAKDDVMWPDEMATPEEIPARQRFARYRGLKSFRTSPWDMYENLPREYARIFQFENFTRTKKRIINSLEENPIEAGTYVTIHVANVPNNLLQLHRDGFPFIVASLLQYENRISVLHFQIMRHPSYTQPIASKEELVFHVGFRRYKMQPIFSQHNANAGKHKYERFLQAGRSSVATIFAPITYGPSPVLLFKSLMEGDALVATGSLMSVDPNRIILKKVVLTGYPFKVHKRTAVVRYMFYDPEDVNWFKPVELFTKYGRTGHILESLGTHGLMKVHFDGGVMSNDTICMNLYRRVYPKWVTKVGGTELPK